MIIHLTGPDTYRSRRRLHQLRQAFQQKHDPQGLNIVLLDGQSATVDDIRSALSATGLFATKRFVSIDRFVPSAKVKLEDFLTALQPAAKSDDSIAVVREEPAPVKDSPYRRAKSKASVTAKIPGAKVEDFPLLQGPALSRWITSEAKERGGSIIPAAAERLAALCSNDSWRIATELDKLLSYVGSRPVAVADVEEMVMSPYRSDIFGLTDAIGNGQTAKALDLLHREFSAGTHPLAVITIIANHLWNLLRVQAGANELTLDQLAKKLSLHPFVVKKALAQSSRLAPERLRAWHHQLVNIDYQLKSSRADAATLLDLLLIRT